MDNGTNTSSEKLALAALICGITSIFIFPLAFGSAGIIFGILVQDRVEKDSRAYQNARLGILFGIIGLALWVFTLATMNYLNVDLNSFFGTPQKPPAF
ncbi:MAG: DUF4190 domain-containing protein [Coriobacteriia bacterium]|nr:DUF4190 domain-containing protein [Coriobacteriia bacterium]